MILKVIEADCAAGFCNDARSDPLRLIVLFHTSFIAASEENIPSMLP